jgi:hypothetical protein
MNKQLFGLFSLFSSNVLEINTVVVTDAYYGRRVLPNAKHKSRFNCPSEEPLHWFALHSPKFAHLSKYDLVSATHVYDC